MWLNAELQDGKMQFTADSDAIIVKGIIALLIEVLNGHTPTEVADADLYFIDRIGLSETYRRHEATDCSPWCGR